MDVHIVDENKCESNKNRIRYNRNRSNEYKEVNRYWDKIKTKKQQKNKTMKIDMIRVK